MKKVVNISKIAISSIGIILSIIVILCIFLIAFDAITISEFTEFTAIVNNLTTPFLTFTAILMAFLAFYAQYEANKKQNILIKKQLHDSHFNNLNVMFTNIVNRDRTHDYLTIIYPPMYYDIKKFVIHNIRNNDNYQGYSQPIINIYNGIYDDKAQEKHFNSENEKIIIITDTLNTIVSYSNFLYTIFNDAESTIKDKTIHKIIKLYLLTIFQILKPELHLLFAIIFITNLEKKEYLMFSEELENILIQDIQYNDRLFIKMLLKIKKSGQMPA